MANVSMLIVMLVYSRWLLSCYVALYIHAKASASYMKHLVSSLLNKIWMQKEKSDTCFKLPRFFCFKRESPKLFKLLQLLQCVKKLIVYLLLLSMVKSLTLSSFHRNPHFLFLLDFFLSHMPYIEKFVLESLSWILILSSELS